MLGVVIPSPRLQAIDAIGHPIPGAQMRAFFAGSSTPTSLYTDADLVTPLSNPVIADAAGVFPAMFSQPVSLKLELLDAGGVLLYTTDNVTPPNLLTGRIDSDLPIGHVIGTTNPAGNIDVGLAAVSPIHVGAAQQGGFRQILLGEIDITQASGATEVITSDQALIARLGASGFPLICTSRFQAPSIITGGATPPVAAAVEVTGYPNAGTERYAIRVRNAPVRFTGGVLLEDATTVTVSVTPQNDWAPTLIGSRGLLPVNPTIPVTITGMAGGANGNPAQPGQNTSGRIIIGINLGTSIITLAHQNVGSVFANRFTCPGAVNYAWNPGTQVRFVYLGAGSWYVG